MVPCQRMKRAHCSALKPKNRSACLCLHLCPIHTRDASVGDSMTYKEKAKCVCVCTWEQRVSAWSCWPLCLSPVTACCSTHPSRAWAKSPSSACRPFTENRPYTQHTVLEPCSHQHIYKYTDMTFSSLTDLFQTPESCAPSPDFLCEGRSLGVSMQCSLCDRQPLAPPTQQDRLRLSYREKDRGHINPSLNHCHPT